MNILRDPRIRAVQWRDLLEQTPRDIALELSLPLPWLVASLALAAIGWWLLAIGASFMFFLSNLRVAHAAQHNTLGLSRRANDWVMFVLSFVTLGSMHAVQVNHMRHHKRCLADDDWEGKSAHMSGWRALIYGPVFVVMIIVGGLRHGNRAKRRWIWAETVMTLAWITVALTAIPYHWIHYHIVIMLVGHCLTSLFTVWLVHRECDADHVIARTQRGRLINLISYNMLLHTEHHLFPRVPTRRLHILAERLDRAAPELTRKHVVGAEIIQPSGSGAS